MRCDFTSRTQPLLASSGAKLYSFCAVCFPSGEVTEHVGNFQAKVFNRRSVAFRVRGLLFIHAVSRLRCTDTHKLQM